MDARYWILDADFWLLTPESAYVKELPVPAFSPESLR